MRLRIVAILLVCLSVSGALAQETKQVIRSMEMNALQNPFLVKQMYRAAWEVDNQPDLSYLVYLETMKQDGKVDEASLETIKTLLPIVKKTSYGMKGKDLAESAAIIQDNPQKAVEQLIANISGQITDDDLTVIQSLKPTVEKQRNEIAQNPVGQTSYPIDIDAF